MEPTPAFPRAGDTGAPLTATVLLAPGCSLLALSLLTEPWRIANRLAGRPAADWQVTSPDGAPVTATNGMTLPVEAGAAAARPAALVIVVAGERPDRIVTPALRHWLRGQAAAGRLLAGVDTGVEALAAAGLLGDHAPTIHPEARSAFEERHLGLGLSLGLYTMGERRATCAGGLATLDFSLALLARFAGSALAERTAEALLHARRIGELQALPEGAGRWRDPRLDRALRYLGQAAFGGDCTSAAVARAAGLSERQLARLMRAGVGTSVAGAVRRLRIERARLLLAETDLPVAQIAAASGHSGPSEFARAFRRETGRSPSAFRADRRGGMDAPRKPV